MLKGKCLLLRVYFMRVTHDIDSVAKSGILSRDLGIFLSSWDFIGIFISAAGIF